MSSQKVVWSRALHPKLVETRPAKLFTSPPPHTHTRRGAAEFIEVCDLPEGADLKRSCTPAGPLGSVTVAPGQSFTQSVIILDGFGEPLGGALSDANMLVAVAVAGSYDAEGQLEEEGEDGSSSGLVEDIAAQAAALQGLPGAIGGKRRLAGAAGAAASAPAAAAGWQLVVEELPGSRRLAQAPGSSACAGPELPVLFGNTTQASNGTALFTAVTVFGRPGQYQLRVVAPARPAVAPALLNVTLRGCAAGEAYLPGSCSLGPVCGVCSAPYYSFDPTDKCVSCSASDPAFCDGPTKLPSPGFWQSSPRSNQVGRREQGAGCMVAPPGCRRGERGREGGCMRVPQQPNHAPHTATHSAGTHAHAHTRHHPCAQTLKKLITTRAPNPQLLNPQFLNPQFLNSQFLNPQFLNHCPADPPLPVTQRLQPQRGRHECHDRMDA